MVRTTFKIILLLTVWMDIAMTHAAGPPLALVPWPKSVEVTPGSRLTLGQGGRIVYEAPDLKPLAEVVIGDLARISRHRLVPATPGAGPSRPGDIVLRYDPAMKGEAYRLTIDSVVTVTGGNYRAVAWGTATLLQAAAVDNGTLSWPKLNISDDSDIPLRSAECDIARKWHPIVNLYELIDLFRYYKINHIQFHMNDHGRFTFGSELYPQLATVKDGRREHYTKEELKDLIAYADARGVSIIPEIEMPGHSDAPRILPEIFGTKDAESGKYINSGYINFTRDDTVQACKALLNEVMDVFASSDLISIGADEVADARLKKMSEYAQFEKDHPDQQLMDYFITQMNDVVQKRGKTLLVYGRGGPMNVLQMPWSGNDNAIAARGHRVMPHNSGSVTNHLVTYHPPPYNTMMLYSGFESAYQFDLAVTKKIAPENLDKVAGIHTLTWQHWHYMHFHDLRRLMASLAENAWNYNSRTSFKPFATWRDTMWAATDRRLDDLVFPVKVEEQGLLSPGKDLVFHEKMTIKLSAAQPGKIRYRIEPLDYFNPPALPDAASPVYSGPLQITAATVIYARLFDERNQPVGYGTERRYHPITPKVTCRAWSVLSLAPGARGEGWTPAAPHDALAKAAATPLPATLDEVAKLGVPAQYTFPLGRLTFQPSYEGVHMWGWLLVMQGRIRIPADGDYKFQVFPETVTLTVDGKPAASNRGKEKTSQTLHLTAGEYDIAVIGPTGHKGPNVAQYQGPGMDKSLPLDELLVPLP
ncbi:MAG: family 20 glycosylhydrolase [Phycisphaeraceae bacterium]